MNSKFNFLSHQISDQNEQYLKLLRFQFFIKHKNFNIQIGILCDFNTMRHVFLNTQTITIFYPKIQTNST